MLLFYAMQIDSLSSGHVISCDFSFCKMGREGVKCIINIDETCCK